MTSYILLQGLHFHARIGVGEQERVVGNEYVINLRIGYPLAKAMKSDDVADTLNYDETSRPAVRVSRWFHCRSIVSGFSNDK